MSSSKPLINPKELLPAAAGFAVGLLLLAGFYLLAKTLGMATFVEYTNLPRQ